MRVKSGFTLIEIMVVLIIIGTIVTFAMLSFGDFGQSRQARASADQLSQYISLLQQKAILENHLLGLRIHQNTYQAMRYSPARGWQTIKGGSTYREQPLPKGLQFYFKKSISGKDVDIIIQTSGDMTPFKLSIGTKSKQQVVGVTGKANGEVLIYGKA